MAIICYLLEHLKVVSSNFSDRCKNGIGYKHRFRSGAHSNQNVNFVVYKGAPQLSKVHSLGA
jgi:hypothetical protein